MIISRLHGRLGNQMFQYAAARSLAARLDLPVGLDAREALARGEGFLTRVFDLPLTTPEPLPPSRREKPLAYALWRYAGRKPYLRREQGLGDNAAVETWGDQSYLHGYWQSEKYFSAIADTIRTDFAFPEYSSTENADMAQRIGETLSIALHVRRGDYVALDAHVLCDQAYYDAALARISNNLSKDPTVFVFSDDPEWARENLPLSFEKVVIDFNGPDRDFEDMRLMSLCQHNIIANSSFSWWAAWLNAHSDKIVAGPANWFGDPKLQNPDILPSGWLRIET